MHDIRYDAVHDEVLVTNPFAQAILVYRGGANGNEAPIRVIQGPHTKLDNPDRLEVDPVHNEIFIPENDRITVYPRDGNGDIAPLRTIQGPDTGLKRADSVGVDPVRDLIVVGTQLGNKPGDGKLLIFNRTDSGNLKPRAVIQGPKTGIVAIHQLQVYSPKGWIIATQPGQSYIGTEWNVEPEGVFIGVWSINDNGDVPPRWMLGGPKSAMKKPRGVAINPKNKEIIVADMSLNAVLTYYFPEVF